MRLSLLTTFFLLFGKSVLTAQISVANPSKNDFERTFALLSSDSLQGRKPNERGGSIAASFVASQMNSYKLKAYNNFEYYFQIFEIQEHTLKKTTLEIKKGNHKTISLSPEKDFEVAPTRNSIQKKHIEVVFASYGLEDYKTLDVANKIVVVLSGFPNDQDSTSTAYKKFKKIFPEESDLEETKLKTAISKGAAALIIIETKENFKPKNSKEKEVFHSLENTTSTSIPVFKIGKTTAENLFSEIPLKGGFPPLPLKKVKINFSIKVQSEPFYAANVLGYIPGKDTTKTIIVGAHYDHLGIKNDSIYNGADDNASGTSGMLALAKKWSESAIKPDYNILFAAWTAEEMGLLGSEYFVSSLNPEKQKILLAINMDMISRSAPEDTTHRILSVGTQKADQELRNIITDANKQLLKPFTLDLWETNRHSGSDYASFTAKGIPILTFFSGYHEDYHTPRDTFEKVDLNKTEAVLSLVNTALLQFIKNQNSAKP
ncbi:M20/M25/M40 family metallo-hydrolase [Flavobacterium hungaricum]|uniref:M20/M25/M40 family metallo-hydrolase n=1 Tax=Flavobacterium hungaricum TaxID=2082725 RepID=A0ABR9TMV3_9FLAO|nr:M20/M25/M40 family metallo-hydrolase [Flavobacterium hungaricum]MBE8726676.1 M20/M25/M40 family metallo-hydrolase [Flavobacterium hungaricum]